MGKAGSPFGVWLVRGVIGTLGLMAVIGSFTFVPALERRGLPGAAVAIGALVLFGAWSVWVVWSVRARPARSRAVEHHAMRIGAAFAGQPSLPRSMGKLPSFSELSGTSGVRDLLTYRADGRPRLVFDRWFEPAEAYRPTRWWTMAATRIDADALQVRIEPRSMVPPVGDGLIEVGSESRGFDARFRVLAMDARFANALVDQRMMLWLLSRDDEATFEVGGPWAAALCPGLTPTDGCDDLVAVLDLFVAHLPPVIHSLRPAVDPAFEPPGS